MSPFRGFTGSPAGGGMSTPHLEPRPWLPAAHDMPFLHPYQMAAIVIGWPLLLPGALGGSYFGGPRRERRTELVMVMVAASGDSGGLGVAAMRLGGVFTGNGGVEVGTGAAIGAAGAEFKGIMKMAGTHGHTSRPTVLPLPASALMKAVDGIRMNRAWRWAGGPDRLDVMEMSELGLDD